MASVWSSNEVDYAKEMSEGKEDKMDADTCSELCQDSDIDGSELPGFKGSVEDLVVAFLWWFGGITMHFCHSETINNNNKKKRKSVHILAIIVRLVLKGETPASAVERETSLIATGHKT